MLLSSEEWLAAVCLWKEFAMNRADVGPCGVEDSLRMDNMWRPTWLKIV